MVVVAVILKLLVMLAALAVDVFAFDGIPVWNPLPPRFPATWALNYSTFFMPCNYSGAFALDNSFYAGPGGIVDYDWSNMRSVWSAGRPMDCEERLLEQAVRTKSKFPHVRTWVYKNIVKALPWMSDVREKITDPAYAGWFLRFAFNTTPHVPTQGSPFYHDQEQTPRGDCGVPCGEYLFDHRNESLREWIIRDYILGKKGMASGVVDGVFMDDFWSNRSWVLPWSGGDCATMPTGGPTEVDGHCVQDMGLDGAQVREIWWQWNLTMQAAMKAVVEQGGYVYQMLNVNAGRDIRDPRAQCTAWLRDSCRPESSAFAQPLLFQFSEETSRPLPSPLQDIAQFLLVRGPYAWIGYSWDGCAPNVPTYERPALLDRDFGVPLEQCMEVQPGVFRRRWSLATVSLNCNTWTPSFEFM